MGTGGIALAPGTRGAVDYFLKIDGIDGESQDSKHKNEFQLLSYSFGASQAHALDFTGGGHGAGKVSFTDFNFIKQVDKGSAKLLSACATGQHIPKAVLIVRKAGKDQQEYLKVTLSDILVSNVQVTGDGSSPLPLDQVSLNYAKIEFEYKEQKADGTLGGSVKVGYDLKQHKAS
ncbi:MAG: type VI secretion system tube protein Hcp [Acidobacteria bacterium]|nr:MAG: type VI secretion system tube protein Hcp [Acidobacteriota bacterium]PYY16086.1 MAG: type VI secretion system tube protein Hcp [Acidobacteriota bacterium]